MSKTASFAIMHFSIAFLVAWLLTGSAWVGGLVALVEPAVNTVAYYWHEKLWQRLEVAPVRSCEFTASAKGLAA